VYLPIAQLVVALSGLSQCPVSYELTNEHAFQQARQECPHDPGIYGQFASFLVAKGDFHAAKAVSEDGLKYAPGDPKLILAHGAAMLSLGQPDKALLELGELPLSAQSEFYIGLANRQLGNHSAAQKALAHAWELGYRDAYLLYAIIEEDRNAGDKPTGMRHFKLFLETFPDSAWMHLLLGDAYFDQKRNDEARREYEQAVQSKPDMMDAHYRLGYLDFLASNNVQAAKEFQTEIDINPNFADAHLFLGETLLRLGQKQNALLQFQKTLSLDPNTEMAYHRYAAVLSDANRLAEAVATLREGEKKFPDDSTFPAELARLLARLNRPEEAHQEAERARVLAAERLKKVDVTGGK
jgi:tetratricopeptide (TPR) repeat protein